MMHEEFPAFFYHKEKGARLFESAEELADAGAGWFDTPAKFTDDSCGQGGPANSYREHMEKWCSEEEKKEKPKRGRKAKA